MEEILASIRKAIDEDSRFAGEGPVSAKPRVPSLQKETRTASEPEADEIVRLADDVLEIARGARGQGRTAPAERRPASPKREGTDEGSVLRPAFGLRDAELAAVIPPEPVASAGPGTAEIAASVQLAGAEVAPSGSAASSPDRPEGAQKGAEMATSQTNGSAASAASPQKPRIEASPGSADAPVRVGDVEAVVATAFEKLAGQLAESRRRSTPTLEDLAKDLMRPVIKEWLDQHLATIVERLVQAEIERVTRRHGL